MGMFVCDKCNHVDVIELAYSSSTFTYDTNVLTDNWRCTMCQVGEWHDLFIYKEYDPETDIVVNRPNGLGLE